MQAKQVNLDENYLREFIDNNPQLKETEDYIKAQTFLQTFYANGMAGKDHNNLVYNFKNLSQYMLDYVKRDIEIAEEYVKMAVRENYDLALKIYANLQEEISGNENRYGELGAIISKTKEEQDRPAPKKIYYNEKLNNDYFNGEIKFNIRDVDAYVRDWLFYVPHAESYILQALAENFSDVAKVFSGLAYEEHVERLFNLIIQNIGEAHYDDFIAIKYERNISLAINDNKKIAEALNDAYNLGVLDKVASKLKWDDLLCRTAGSNPLFDIQNSETLVKIWLALNDKKREYFTKLIFEYSILDSVVPIWTWDNERAINIKGTINTKDHQKKFIDALSLIKTHLIPNTDEVKQIEASKPKWLNKGKSSKNFLGTEKQKLEKKDIHIDYYIASANMEKDKLLDLAWHGNKRMFKKLFLQEIEAMKDYGMEHTVESRAKFYKDLMQEPDMQSLSYYNDLLEAVNKAFSQPAVHLEKITEVEAKKSNTFKFFRSKSKVAQKEFLNFPIDDEGQVSHKKSLDGKKESLIVPKSTPVAKIKTKPAKESQYNSNTFFNAIDDGDLENNKGMNEMTLINIIETPISKIKK